MVAFLDLVVNLLTVDGHVSGGFDAQLDHVAFRAHDLHHNATINDDVFVDLAGEDEHGDRG